jgi:excisionase family DNA binding protein
MIILEGRQYFTLAEAAKLLRRHYNTVYQWTLRDKISFHQPWPGAKILIPEAEIMRLRGHQDVKDSNIA